MAPEHIHKNIADSEKDVVVFVNVQGNLTHAKNVERVFDTLAIHRVVGVYDYRVTMSELIDDIKASGYELATSCC